MAGQIFLAEGLATGTVELMMSAEISISLVNLVLSCN